MATQDSVKVFGAGICSLGAHMCLKELKINHKIYSNNDYAKKFYELKSSQGKTQIISGLNNYGLSKYYHGVMPSSIFNSEENCNILRLLNFGAVPKNPLENYTSFFPIRSSTFLKNNSDHHQVSNEKLNHDIDKSLKSKSPVVLALSVVGNIQALQRNKLIENKIYIHDHIIFQLGTVSRHDLKKLTSTNKIVKNHFGGVSFLSIEHSNALLTFRPKYSNSSKSIDYSFSATNIIKFLKALCNPSQLLDAIFNRFGLYFPVKEFNIFAQIQVKKCLVINNGVVKMSQSFEKDYFEEIKSLKNEIIGLHNFYKFYPDSSQAYENYTYGVHLSYDRNYLKHTPSNILVLDTSLSEVSKVSHPTISSLIKSFKTIKSFFNN